MSTAGPIPAADVQMLEPEYEVLRELGRGAMGVVVLARHRAAGYLVAIKVVHPRTDDAHDAEARLEREARTVSRMRHPSIVRHFEMRRLSTGGIALVMQYIAGETLAHLLRETPRLSPAIAEHVLRDLGSALQYAHAQHVVHRDVKPANVFVYRDTGAALLSDFGIAKSFDVDTDITHVGFAIGTPTYMSPEQLGGFPVDGRSDLYSLGVVGWEMLSGVRPWAGESLYGVIYKQKFENLPRLAAIRSDVPARVLYAIDGALEKDPDLRFASADEFLAQLAQDEPTEATLRRHAARHSDPLEVVNPRAANEAVATVQFRRPDVAAPAATPAVEAATVVPEVSAATPGADAITEEEPAVAEPVAVAESATLEAASSDSAGAVDEETTSLASAASALEVALSAFEPSPPTADGDDGSASSASDSLWPLFVTGEDEVPAVPVAASTETTVESAAGSAADAPDDAFDEAFANAFAGLSADATADATADQTYGATADQTDDAPADSPLEVEVAVPVALEPSAHVESPAALEMESAAAFDSVGHLADVADETPVAAAPPEPVASDVAVETPVWSDDAPAAEPPTLGADVPLAREPAAPVADAGEASEAPAEAPYAWLDRLTSYEPPFSRGSSPTADAEEGEEVLAEPPSVDEQTLSASLEAALRAALPPSRPVPTEEVPPLIPFAPPPTPSPAADEAPAFAIGADEPPTPTPTIEAATTDDAVPVTEVRAPAPAPVAPPRDAPAPVTAAPVASDVETPPRAADVETPRVAPGAIVMPPLGQRPVITLREPRKLASEEPAPAPAPAPRAAKPGETDFDRLRGAAAAPPTARPQGRSRSPRRVAAIAAVALVAATGVGALVYGRRAHESPPPRLASRGARATDSATVATATVQGVAATDSARARGEDTSSATASSNYGARGSTPSVPPVVVSTASLSPSLPMESMRMATTGEHRAAGRRAAGAARPARPATAPAATLSPTERAAASALASAERLLAQRDYRAARAAAEQAVTLAPRGPRGYVVRSRVRLHQGELREAWADAEMAARLGDLLSAQAATAIVEERAGDTASARIRVERLARAVDARGDALAPRDNALLAMALAAVGDAAGASEALRRLPNDAARAAAIGDPSFDGVRRDPRFRPYDAGGRRGAADSTRRRP